RLEVGRIRDAMLSGFGLACALIFAFAMAYVSSERDKKVDFSYFRTTRPGDSTRNIVRTLKQPVQVGLFFPPANEVADRVKSYFDDLKRESTLLEVSSFDFAVDPAKAKELGATGNGIVTVTRQGGRREALNIGLELEAARTQLRTLDKEVNRRLLLVSRTGHTVFLTTGHSERSPERPPGSETDKRATIKLLRDLLVEQGYQVRNLGLAQGLANEVPAEAAAVLIIGPTRAFLPEEIAALNRYMNRGGKLLVALDPEPDLNMKELLRPLGVEFLPTMLASDQ